MAIPPASAWVLRARCCLHEPGKEALWQES